MKRVLLLILLVSGFNTLKAQWSDSTNHFYDSLDMPVARALSDQRNPLVVKSQSDGGYFIIWEDMRNGIGNWDIYAQKYDKGGRVLWATNGVPVATGPAVDQQYFNISNGTYNYANYQSVSHAATDGNGGFYITWQIYVGSVGNYAVYVQHIRADGTRVFADEGYGLAVPTVSSQRYTQPQLIADGAGGFFIGYITTASGYYATTANLVLYNYKDVGGTLKRNGGGIMNGVVNYYNSLNSYYYCSVNNVGGYKQEPISAGGFANTSNFKIFDDLQGGCGVVMTLSMSGERNFPAFNQLCRVKQDRDVEIPNQGTIHYKKDSMVVLYKAELLYTSVDCAPENAPPGSTFINNYYVLVAHGALNLFINKYTVTDRYDDRYPGSGKYHEGLLKYGVDKISAAVLPSDGNMNALLVTWNQRDYTNSQVTSWATRGVVFPMEKYDDIPTYLKPSLTLPPLQIDKLNYGKSELDTLLAVPGVSSGYDYGLTGSGSRAFLFSSINGLGSSSGPSPFYYQEVKLIRQSADSFAVKKMTGAGKEAGLLIGTGTTNDRFLASAGDGAGNATFFYTGPNGRDYVKASPIDPGGKLRWGAMGLPLNSGGVSGSYYTPGSGFLYQDADGKGVIAWQDNRRTPDGYTGTNVYMRHLDSLIKPGYQPPALNTRLTTTPPNTTTPGRSFSQSNPQSLAGTSGAWTTFQVPVSVGTNIIATPVAAIRDDYNLGTVSVSTYDFYNQPLRTTNGKAYMDRNYTISVTNHPPGASIHVRLIFTKAQFDAMKAQDASIQDPGHLAVLKQPSTGTAPASYTPSSNDKGIKPLGWGTFFAGNTSVITGYYIEVVIDDFSNFFIMSGVGILPVTLQSFTVNAVDHTALLQWVTASELNNDHFDVERSADGRVFSRIARVEGNGTTSLLQTYRFTDAAPLTGNNYYRLAQVDVDGRIEYSPVRLLTFNGQAGKMLLSPNPVKSILHVVLPEPASGQDLVEVYNLAGLRIQVQNVAAGTLQTDVDVSNLSPGVYVVRYGTTRLKLVKE